MLKGERERKEEDRAKAELFIQRLGFIQLKGR